MYVCIYIYIYIYIDKIQTPTNPFRRGPVSYPARERHTQHTHTHTNTLTLKHTCCHYWYYCFSYYQTYYYPYAIFKTMLHIKSCETTTYRIAYAWAHVSFLIWIDLPDTFGCIMSFVGWSFSRITSSNLDNDNTTIVFLSFYQIRTTFLFIVFSDHNWWQLLYYLLDFLGWRWQLLLQMRYLLSFLRWRWQPLLPGASASDGAPRGLRGSPLHFS